MYRASIASRGKKGRVYVCVQRQKEMSLLLLQLSLFAAVVIKLTSSQSTYDVTYHDNDVTGCGSSGQIVQTLHQLMNAVSQLQKDVAEQKNCSCPPPTGGVKGKYCEVVK